MEIEKEVRYMINKNQINKIIEYTTPYKDKIEMLDITCGYDGFESYAKYGFICRIRKKGDKKTLEVKNYSSKNECIEQSINIEKISDGVNYLKLIGMEPYLYLKRMREVRKFNSLKIFIDEFDILGNFVEIEYQDSENGEIELKKFVELIGIKGIKQDMYGGIVKDKLKSNPEFKIKFNKGLLEILEKY